MDALEEHIRLDEPHIVALLDTHISGSRVNEVCNRLNFRGMFRVEAQGFQGGIWLLWDENEVNLSLIKARQQFVTIEVTRRGSSPRIFTAIYASPELQMRETLRIGEFCEEK